VLRQCAFSGVKQLDADNGGYLEGRADFTFKVAFLDALQQSPGNACAVS